jgi:uncharacterized membrane protein YfcA
MHCGPRCTSRDLRRHDASSANDAISSAANKQEIDVEHAVLLAAATFIGALVSGLAGFAFSAAAGAFLLHSIAPQEAVPLMMACSIGVQAASLLWLRQVMCWRDSSKFIAGGMLGILPALYLLTHVDATLFRVGFGAFLAGYSAYMLFRPRMLTLQKVTAIYDGAVGFIGGLIGGLTAMPGAAPIVWCDLKGLPKEQQRGLVQPFIAVMQITSVAALVGTGKLSTNFLPDLLVAIPAVAAGTAAGIYMFGKVNDLTFRRLVLSALLISGISFLIH